MGMAVLPAHPSTSTSTSSSSCVMAYCDSHFTYTSDLHSTPNENLWSDIDLAERFLVSSQFDEAIALSSALLQRLKDIQENFEGIQDENEVDDMIESSGMVFIQAYSESGKSNIMLSDLAIIFGSLSKVHPALFFSGVCLQISAGIYSDAQSSIEAYLKDWAFTSVGEKLCRFKPAETIRHGSVFLKPAMYLDITELYCIEVLSKGLRNTDAALHWLRDATHIPADRREGIREMIERLSLEKDKREGINTKSDIDYNGGSLLQPTVVSGSPVVSSVVSGYDENKMTMIHVHKKGDSHSLLSNFRSFPLIELISGWIASHGYSSRCDKLLCVLSQQKTTFTGAAVVFLMIALYKQKHNISRIVKGLTSVLGIRTILHAIYVGIYDLWQLAFNVQLNPLAVVQP